MAFLDETGLAELWSLIKAKDDELTEADVKIATGTYEGVYKFGADNPTVITLPFPPKFILIFSTTWAYHAYGIRGGAMVCIYSDDNEGLSATWTDNAVQFYHTSSSSYQMNRSDVTYSYIAIG